MVQAWTGAHLDPFLRKVSILGVTSHLRKFHEIVQVKTADYRTRETATTNYKICENNLYVHIGCPKIPVHSLPPQISFKIRRKY